MSAAVEQSLPEPQPAIRALDAVRRERSAAGRAVLLLVLGERRSLLGEKLACDGPVDLPRRGCVRALDVEAEELHVAEDVGALTPGSVFGSSGNCRALTR